MRIANKNDLARMKKVLICTFENDPHISWFIGNPTNRAVAIRRCDALMEYMCCASLSCGLAFVNENINAVALWQNSAKKPTGIAFFLSQIKYLFICGIKSTLRSLQMEKEVSSRMPKSQYIFLWTIGIEAHFRGQGIFRSMVQPILNDAESKKIPVYLETTIEENIAIYQHYGFQIKTKYFYKDSPEICVMAREFT